MVSPDYPQNELEYLRLVNEHLRHSLFPIPLLANGLPHFKHFLFLIEVLSFK